MGETQNKSSSNPKHIVIMRNSRGKLFAYVAVLGVLCFVVFLLSSTHNNLKELELVNERCQQQRDSLSAQLQVVYEHKNRLEKSLQQEKTEHKHAKETNEKLSSDLGNQFQKEKDERQKLENQLSQLKTKFSELEDEKTRVEVSLKQQLKTMEKQKNTEIEKLQTHISDLLSEKDKLETSNNGYLWKIEQHANEMNLRHLEITQAKKDLSECKQQLNTRIVTNIANNKLNVAETKSNANVIFPQAPPEVLKPKIEESLAEKQQVQNVVIEPENKTASPPSHSKTPILERPHLMPQNNLGDGVLPKPMDIKNDIDAAMEVANEKLAGDQLLSQINGRYKGKVEMNKDDLVKPPALENLQAKEIENHPQVVPPNVGIVDEKDDHGGERGEDGFQYPDAKHQVDVPDFKPNEQELARKPLPPPDNDVMAHMVNDMMNKSPGEVNNNEHLNSNERANNHPFAEHSPQLGPIDNKIQDLKSNNGAFLRRGEGHGMKEDNNYEEADDDDRENDDEPANGLAPVMKSNNILQDNDFDDQENQDNGDNAKEVEGVVAAPK